VKNGFEFPAGGRVGKDDPGQFLPPEPSVWGDDAGPEPGLDFNQGRLAGFDEPMRQLIGIHHRHVAGAEEFSRGGLAHPQAAGQTADFHWLKV